MSSGMPMAKYHFRVLCRKANIPAYTPTLPKAAAIKNNNPSEILSASFFFDLFLSNSITRKATALTVRKKL
jgi:hypothetical protein